MAKERDSTVNISREDLKSLHFLQSQLGCKNPKETLHKLIRRSLELFGVALP